MKDRLVTLIGGGGFLGRYAAQALLKAGARVRIAQRDPRQAFFLRPQGGLGQTQFVAVDITKADTVRRAVQGSDAVVNFVGVRRGGFAAVHVAGARNVAAAATEHGIARMVHISAIGADPASASNYGRTKGEGEQAVLQAAPGATILRPSVVFGREDEFITMFAQLIARLPVVPVLRPTWRVQPVFVGDVADAIVGALARHERVAGQTLDVGGPDVLTMAELQRWIARAIGRAPAFLDVPDAAGGALASLGFLPGAPISRDEWAMLQHDSVVTGANALDLFDVAPTALAAVAPQWLVRFRRQGRFGARVAASA